MKFADTVEDVEEVVEDDIDTNKTADADGEWWGYTTNSSKIKV